ncbi:MAG: hypothetical protein J7521_10520 [Caulobacter sp.]|nr:hypothetical protein [Caulobacter sp.]
MAHARIALAILAAAVSGPGLAQAQNTRLPSPPALSLARPGLVLSRPAMPVLYDRAPTPLPAGVARTSVEHGADGVTGSAGLLCGIQPSADTSGAARARGFDPEGKFVGGKVAFRF